MSKPPVQYFCNRPGGVLTPLVPVDELPSHISIRGVPPRLMPGQTHGMTSLGTLLPRPEPFIVDTVNVPHVGRPGNSISAPHRHGVHVHGDDVTMSANSRMETRPRGAPHTGTEAWWAFATGGASTAGAISAAGAIGAVGARNPSNPKKIYCSYWIRHGECDYQQQGCLYKHEMPLDLATLETLGLRDIPRWYREKHNVPSLAHSSPRPQINNGHAARAIQFQPRPVISGAGNVAASASVPRPGTTYVPKPRVAVPTQSRSTIFETPKAPVIQSPAPKKFSNNSSADIGDLMNFDSVPPLPATKSPMDKITEVDEESEDPLKSEYNSHRGMMGSKSPFFGESAETPRSFTSCATTPAQSRIWSPVNDTQTKGDSFNVKSMSDALSAATRKSDGDLSNTQEGLVRFGSEPVKGDRTDLGSLWTSNTTPGQPLTRESTSEEKSMGSWADSECEQESCESLKEVGELKFGYGRHGGVSK